MACVLTELPADVSEEDISHFLRGCDIIPDSDIKGIDLAIQRRSCRVTFTSPEEASKALAMTGAYLGGKRVVVTLANMV